MESFQIKGDDGEIKIKIEEVYGFPNQTCFSGGYECKAVVEIKIPCYHAKGTFYTSTGEVYRFYEQLKTCQEKVSGEANYSTLEGNFEMKVKYNALGQTEITGKYQHSLGVLNCLNFEIGSDQSFMKYTLAELEVIVKKYGGNKGIIEQKS